MGSLLVDWKDDFLTGMGYNTATGQLCSTRTVKVEADPQTASSTVSPTSGSKLVEADDSFAAAMNLSASYSTSYCGIGMSASASFMLDMKINRKTSAVVKYVHWRDDHPTQVYTPATELNATARRVLENDGPEAFYNQFGDCFIGGYYKGGQCFAGYRMEFSSVEEKIQAKASVGLSYSATNGSANFEIDLNSKKVSCSRDLRWYAVGYPAGEVPATDGTWKEAVDFLDKVNTRLGNKLQAMLARYNNLKSYTAAVEVYKAKHPGAPSFIVPDSAFPGSQAIKDFNEVYAQLSYVRSQLAHAVKIGLIYDNPGDIERQDCLQKITDFQDNILEKLTPHDLKQAEETKADPFSRFRMLQKEGEKLVKASQAARDNFDGSVIELWNVARIGSMPHRGDVRVTLQSTWKGADLALYSAGPKAGLAPGPPPIKFDAKINLASKFKVWVAEGDFFALQALGVAADEPVFVAFESGHDARLSPPFLPSGVRMNTFTASFTRADIFGDNPVRLDIRFCLKKRDAGNGMVFLTVWEPPNNSRVGRYYMRVGPTLGPQSDWSPAGNDITPYCVMGLNQEMYPNAPIEWHTDANAQWQIRIVEDPAGAGGRVAGKKPA